MPDIEHVHVFVLLQRTVRSFSLLNLSMDCPRSQCQIAQDLPDTNKEIIDVKNELADDKKETSDAQAASLHQGRCDSFCCDCISFTNSIFSALSVKHCARLQQSLAGKAKKIELLDEKQSLQRELHLKVWSILESGAMDGGQKRRHGKDTCKRCKLKRRPLKSSRKLILMCS
jgi:hypothetical protein